MKKLLLALLLFCMCFTMYAQQTLSKQESQTYIDEYYTCLKSVDDFKNYYNLHQEKNIEVFMYTFLHGNYRTLLKEYPLVREFAQVSEIGEVVQVDSMLYCKARVSIKEHFRVPISTYKKSGDILNELKDLYDTRNIHKHDSLRTLEFRLYDSISYSDSTLYGRGEDLFVFYKSKSAEKWKVLSYAEANIKFFFTVIPKDAFYKMEGLDKSECENTSLGLRKLGEYVFSVISTENDVKFYCKVGAPYSLMQLTYPEVYKEYRYEETAVYLKMIHSKETIEKYLNKLRKICSNEKCNLKKIYADSKHIYKESGYFACPIMFEMEIDGVTKFLQINCVSLDKKTWYVTERFDGSPSFPPFKEIVDKSKGQ